MGLPAPSREHTALVPVMSFSTPTSVCDAIAGGFVLLVIKRRT